jgi:serine O-acetyltransferase
MLDGDTNENPSDIGFIALLAEDLRVHDGNPFQAGFVALAIHRFGNWRMGVRPRLLRAPFSLCYKMLYYFSSVVLGITLCYNTKIGRRLRIWHHGGIFVGGRSIGDDVHLRHNSTIGVLSRAEDDQKPVVGDRVDIGCGVAILGPVVVGNDVVIGANSVVVRDVADRGTVFGVPARPVKLMQPAKEE